MKRCPLCEAPITVFALMWAPASSRLRCPNCGRRLKLTGVRPLTLMVSLAYFLLGCLSFMLGFRLFGALIPCLATGITIYLLVCVPLIELLACLYVHSNKRIQVNCPNDPRISSEEG